MTSKVKAARRDRLLDVAQEMFVTQGFRGTTMEGIAEAAGLSKVTVYGYFRDKEAAFEAVAQRLCDRLRAAVIAELAAPGPVAERIGRALVAKHGLVHEVVGTSALATELMAQKVVVARLFNALDAEIIGALAALLADRQAARILFCGSVGIAAASGSRTEMEADILRLVGAVVH